MYRREHVYLKTAGRLPTKPVFKDGLKRDFTKVDVDDRALARFFSNYNFFPQDELSQGDTRTVVWKDERTGLILMSSNFSGVTLMTGRRDMGTVRFEGAAGNKAFSAAIDGFNNLLYR